MLQPGRKYSGGSGYRYGFNGKENDKDVKGDGNQQDYGMRVYDSRIGRFLSVDPLSSKFAWLTVYQFASNTPLQATDLDGQEAFFIHGTASDPTRWYVTGEGKDKKEDFTLIKGLFALTNSNYRDVSFSWDITTTVARVVKSPTTGQENTNIGSEKLDKLTNDKIDRFVAAQLLAIHIMNYRKKMGIDKYDENGNVTEYGSEQITLIGHSHGGNVAIQAAQLLYEKHGLKSDLITIETPTYNDEKGSENPDNPAINKHIHISNNRDGVQGTLAGGDYYNNAKTLNIRLDVSKYYNWTQWKASHSFDNEHMNDFLKELLKHPTATLRESERVYEGSTLPTVTVISKKRKG